MDRLVGGAGTLGSQKPVKTIGSYWPYAPSQSIAMCPIVLIGRLTTPEDAHAQDGDQYACTLLTCPSDEIFQLWIAL